MTEQLQEAERILNAKGFIPARVVSSPDSKLLGLEIYCMALLLHGTVYKIKQDLMHLGLRIWDNSNEEKIYITS